MFALPPHTQQKGCGFNFPIWDLSVWSFHGDSVGSPASSHSPKCCMWDKLGSLSLCLRVNDCLSLSGAAVHWWPAQGATLPSPYSSWVGHQQTPMTLNSRRSMILKIDNITIQQYCSNFPTHHLYFYFVFTRWVSWILTPISNDNLDKKQH